jgi:hypothetical protein
MVHPPMTISACSRGDEYDYSIAKAVSYGGNDAVGVHGHYI